jgi:hypothetical protein
MTQQYVDVDYAGGGLTEYKIFDTSSNKYDATACKLGDTRRCVRMDCHSSVSNIHGLWRDIGETVTSMSKYQQPFLTHKLMAHNLYA